MPVSEKVRSWLQRILPELTPQPFTAQLKNTLEFPEAEEKFKLVIEDWGRWVELYKIGVMQCEDGPYYQTIWANKGRPYIRIYDSEKGDLWDIFLLPKS